MNLAEYWIPAFAGMTAVLDASPAYSNQPFEQIGPIRIFLFDQPDLPATIPFFEPLLALDRILDVIELLEIDQPTDVVRLREPFNASFAMLPNATNQIVGHADVKRTTNFACQNVDVEMLVFHLWRLGVLIPAFAEMIAENFASLYFTKDVIARQERIFALADRAIQYSVTFVFSHEPRGILDPRLRGDDVCA